MALAAALPAAAYTQDTKLEAALARSDANALARFPAKGFANGAADFFVAHDLYVVPGSERAWCTTQAHGVLKPGCYVEFVFQGKGRKATSVRGAPCGAIARWYKAAGSSEYVPTPGAYFAKAIADGDDEAIDNAIYDRDPPPDCR